MCRKIKVVLISLIFAILYCCQGVYTRTLEGVLARAAEDDGKETLYAEIKGYQLEYAAPNGKNGYYKSLPRIALRHQDEGLITKYRFTVPGGEVMEGEVDTEKKEICWEGMKEDGTYFLEVWLEKVPEPDLPEPELPTPEVTPPEPPVSELPDAIDTNEEDIPKEEIPDIEEPEELPPEYSEEEMKKWSQNFTWKVDSIPPQIVLISPIKEGWYNQEVLVKAAAKDNGSGVAELKGGEGKESYQSDGESIQFKVRSTSMGGQPVRVWVTAEDQAGNIAETAIPVYIDRTAPGLSISGADNYLISGRDLELTFAVLEENICQSKAAIVEQETPEGEKLETQLSEWQTADNRQMTTVQLKQDGIYRFKLTASDAAGNQSEAYKQVIVDKTNPIIRFVELFHGKWMKEFCWNYEVAETIEDFTTYTYQLELDGRLYTPGQRIVREGRHVLKLKAKDAAGNEAFNMAEFMIDRTPPVILCEEQAGQVQIADGQNFEKEAAVQIRTENEEDTITAIQINGKKQTISPKSNVYRYSFEEERPYEITVSALDKAGNKTVKELGIQIVHEKSLAERVSEPVRKIFEKEGRQESGSVPGSKEKKNESSGLAVGIALLILVCGGGAGIFLAGHGKTKKDSHKREDAG